MAPAGQSRFHEAAPAGFTMPWHPRFARGDREMLNFLKFKIFAKKPPVLKTGSEDKSAPNLESLSLGHGFAAGYYDYDAIWYYERSRWQA
jgi:hypothetical protein